MVSVSPSSVRDRISISASEAPDIVVVQFIADAIETVAKETGLIIDHSNSKSQEAVAIRNLAAICRTTRAIDGSAMGWASK